MCQFTGNKPKAPAKSETHRVCFMSPFSLLKFGDGS